MSSKFDTACGKAWLEECHDLPFWEVRYISMSAWVSLHFVHRSRFIRAVSKGTENKLEGITFPPTAVGFPLMRFSEDLKWTHLISGYILEAVLEETVFNTDTDSDAFMSGYALKNSVTKWVDFVLSTCHTASSTSCKLVHIRNSTTSTSPFLPFSGTGQWKTSTSQKEKQEEKIKPNQNKTPPIWFLCYSDPTVSCL